MEGVLRQAVAGAEIPIGANLVEGMGIGVTGNHAEPVVIPGGESSLQAVVVGAINVPHLKDVAQEGERRIERPAGLFVAQYVIGGDVLVNVPDADQVRAAVSNVCNLQREIRRERVLNVQIPVVNVRSGDVAINTHDGTRRSRSRVATDRSSGE